MARGDGRLVRLNGEGNPPRDKPVQVLCEDHSGTYQLPFACRFVDGEWRNIESGGTVEATVVGWRLRRPRFKGSFSSKPGLLLKAKRLSALLTPLSRPTPLLRHSLARPPSFPPNAL